MLADDPANGEIKSRLIVRVALVETERLLIAVRGAEDQVAEGARRSGVEAKRRTWWSASTSLSMLGDGDSLSCHQANPTPFSWRRAPTRLSPRRALPARAVAPVQLVASRRSASSRGSCDLQRRSAALIDNRRRRPHTGRIRKGAGREGLIVRRRLARVASLVSPPDDDGCPRTSGASLCARPSVPRGLLPPPPSGLRRTGARPGLRSRPAYGNA